MNKNIHLPFLLGRLLGSIKTISRFFNLPHVGGTKKGSIKMVEIRGMIYSTNWIERLNRDYKRVLNMRTAMPNPQSVILLMGWIAQNKDTYKYPIYNFLESSLFY